MTLLTKLHIVRATTKLVEVQSEYGCHDAITDAITDLSLDISNLLTNEDYIVLMNLVRKEENK